ncbi:MAG: PH domain-containing protein [Candidatus Limnocylindrales bacterium]
MSYADTLMAKGEQVQYRARQHWLAPLSDARNALLLVLVGVVLALIERQVFHWAIRSIFGIVDLVLVLIGLVWIGIVYFSWRAEEYIITNRRVLKVEGLLDKKSGDSSLEKINDALLKQGILARMLHYGDLEILTANEEGLDRYQMLAHVVDFKKAMLNAKNELEDAGRRPGMSSAAAAAPAAPAAASKAASSDDATATLAKLASLRDKGAITAAEYEAKKAELLGRI